MQKAISVKLEPRQIAQLNDLAIKTGCTRHGLLKMFILEMLGRCADTPEKAAANKR